MTEEDKLENTKESRSHYWWIALSIIPLYIISIFPVALIMKFLDLGHDTPFAKALEFFYMPLLWAMDNLTFFERIMTAIAKFIGLA